MAQIINDKALDNAIDELFKDYKKALRVAAQEAIDKARDDIYIKSISCLVDYYNDYPPANYTLSYNRTYNLMKCLVPYSNPVKETADGYDCEAGIEYNGSLLENTYSGSKQYSPTDPNWIIDNYLAGIHPRTDGSREIGGGNYEEEKYQGAVVPFNIMNNYINSYNDTFNKNLRFLLSKQILKLTRK